MDILNTGHNPVQIVFSCKIKDTLIRMVPVCIYILWRFNMHFTKILWINYASSPPPSSLSPPPKVPISTNLPGVGGISWHATLPLLAASSHRSVRFWGLEL